MSAEFALLRTCLIGWNVFSDVKKTIFPSDGAADHIVVYGTANHSRQIKSFNFCRQRPGIAYEPGCKGTDNMFITECSSQRGQRVKFLLCPQASMSPYSNVPGA